MTNLGYTTSGKVRQNNSLVPTPIRTKSPRKRPNECAIKTQAIINPYKKISNEMIVANFYIMMSLVRKNSSTVSVSHDLMLNVSWTSSSSFKSLMIGSWPWTYWKNASQKSLLSQKLLYTLMTSFVFRFFATTLALEQRRNSQLDKRFLDHRRIPSKLKLVSSLKSGSSWIFISYNGLIFLNKYLSP